jgi:hypothetical protein
LPISARFGALNMAHYKAFGWFGTQSGTHGTGGTHVVPTVLR